MHLEFREPVVLPKYLPLNIIKTLLKTAYQALDKPQTQLQHAMNLRNVAVLEMLFATGLRVSELCSITSRDIDLKNGFVKVWGKGARERIIFISNSEALAALRLYRNTYSQEIMNTGWFFVNRLGHAERGPDL